MKKIEWIASKFENAVKTPCREGFKYQFTVDGKHVCLNGLMRLFGISPWYLKRGRAASLGQNLQEDNIRGRRRYSSKSSVRFRLIGVLKTYFEKYGDKSPVNDEIHFPCFIGPVDLYQYILNDKSVKRILNGQSFSKSQFLAIMRLHFQNIKFPCFTRY